MHVTLQTRTRTIPLLGAITRPNIKLNGSRVDPAGVCWGVVRILEDQTSVIVVNLFGRPCLFSRLLGDCLQEALRIVIKRL